MRPRAQRDGLLVQSVGEQLVVYDPARQRLHVLSRTAALVWRHCDGRHDVTGLRELVAGELGTPADETLIGLALAELEEAHLLEGPAAPADGLTGLSRREVLHRAAALAAGVLLPPLVTSCGSPVSPSFVDPTANLVDPTTTIGTTAPTTTTAIPSTTTSTTAIPTTTTSPFPTTTTTPIPTTTTSPFPTTTTTPAPTTTTTPAPRKVRLCHQGRTIEVDERSVAAHLEHGDTLGPCPP